MRLFNVIFILFLLGFAFQTYAQEEETDESEKKEDFIIMEEESIDDEGSDFFDFDAGDDEGGDELFSTTTEEKSKKEKKKKEKKERTKPSLTHSTYFHRPGNMLVKLGTFYMNTPRSTSPPISMGYSMTLFRNFEFGAYLIFFNFRDYVHMDTVQNATAWNLDQPKIGHLMFAAKGSYHFGEYIKRAFPVFEVEKFDPYLTFSFGKNALIGTVENPEIHSTARIDNRLMYGAGMRYMYNEFLSLFVEGVVGDYGVLNFGVDIRVSDLRF